ncbi:hypothetical protein [Solemya velesiana gill symbiont]|nr:hypothetical protein [Solemya velesiana gill symbiont]
MNWLTHDPGPVSETKPVQRKLPSQPHPAPGRLAPVQKEHARRPTLGFESGARRERQIAKAPAVAPMEGETNAEEGELRLSIRKGFRPVGFRIGVVQQNLPLSNHSNRLFKQLPDFDGPSQKYGVIRLAAGQQYRFVLDTDPAGYRLYLDRNRNGDLTDDGPAVENRGKGRFAGIVSLPLGRVTGLRELEGDYEHWIFANSQSWQENALRYYSRT